MQRGETAALVERIAAAEKRLAALEADKTGAPFLTRPGSNVSSFTAQSRFESRSDTRFLSCGSDDGRSGEATPTVRFDGRLALAEARIEDIWQNFLTLEKDVRTLKKEDLPAHKGGLRVPGQGQRLSAVADSNSPLVVNMGSDFSGGRNDDEARKAKHVTLDTTSDEQSVDGRTSPSNSDAPKKRGVGRRDFTREESYLPNDEDVENLPGPTLEVSKTFSAFTDAPNIVIEDVDDRKYMWTVEQTSLLAEDWELQVQKHPGKVQVMDRSTYSSVRATVDTLNDYPGNCPNGICVIFSKSQNTHVVLYREDQKDQSFRMFCLQDDGPDHDDDDQLPVGQSGSFRSFASHASERLVETGKLGFTRMIARARTAIFCVMEPQQGSGPFDHGALVNLRSGALAERYEMIQRLGEGVQGAAHLVKRKGTEQLFVAKETLDTTPDGIQDFKAEFERLRELRHPNCLKVVELLEGPSGKELYIISEVAYGGDLYSFMQAAASKDGLTQELIAGLVKQALQGVAFLHTNGVVHNDLKPDNILVMDEYTPDTDARAVIADYGCLTLRTDSNFICGDPRYLSPEAMLALQKYRRNGSSQGLQKHGPGVDIWAMGVTLFELMSGGVLPFVYEKLPKDSLSEESTWDKLETCLISPSPVSVSPYCVDVHPDAEALLKGLLHVDAKRRPTAHAALNNPWFQTMSGARRRKSMMPQAVAANVDFTATRDQARQILLNALAYKLEYQHVRDCHKAFNEFDEDNTGLLRREHFKDCLERLGKDTARADEIFDKADIDKSNTLEFNEFVALTYDWRSLDNGNMDKYIRQFMDDIAQNPGGAVGENELGKLFEGVLTKPQVRELITRIQGGKSPGGGMLSPRSKSDTNVSLGDLKTYLKRATCIDTQELQTQVLFAQRRAEMAGLESGSGSDRD